jgi:hypothetical protein
MVSVELPIIREAITITVEAKS